MKKNISDQPSLFQLYIYIDLRRYAIRKSRFYISVFIVRY